MCVGRRDLCHGDAARHLHLGLAVQATAMREKLRKGIGSANSVSASMRVPQTSHQREGGLQQRPTASFMPIKQSIRCYLPATVFGPGKQCALPQVLGGLPPLRQGDVQDVSHNHAAICRACSVCWLPPHEVKTASVAPSCPKGPIQGSCITSPNSPIRVH